MSIEIGRMDALYQNTQKLMCQFREQLNCFDRNKIGYNFVFMFASPRSMRFSSKAGEEHIPFAKLQYRSEYKLIKDSVSAAKKEVTMHKVHATLFNLQFILEHQRPGAIHFSGHGVTAEIIKA